MGHDDDDTKITLPTLWAIGVGAAIGGDFFGWQFIMYGGFYSSLIAVTIAAIFFWIYGNAIMELAARYKSSGGAFDFACNAYVSSYGSIVASFVLLKLILANCATCLAISSYLVVRGMPTE
jgi:amino acid transporter